MDKKKENISKETFVSSIIGTITYSVLEAKCEARSKHIYPRCSVYSLTDRYKIIEQKK